MASVSSLDRDLRKMRLDKYTPGAAREARTWIEEILGEPLAPGDLLEALKDGVALCRLANLAIPPPGIRFKQSAMPFVQMENISHFLRACQAPPLNLQQHDCFLTVDLYEAKDPAQVLQCLGAFSRAANNVKPSAFPTAIGPRAGGAGNRNSVVSPQNTGYGSTPTPTSPPGSAAAARGTTPTSTGRPISSIYSGRTPLAPTRTGGDSAVSGRWSPTKGHERERSTSPSKSPTSTSSWSKRELEGSTAPAWNIAQYGYMGGASQGNLGISFGGRRQITSAGPSVPNTAEKERQRREKEAEEARQREEEERRRAEIEAEEERARQEEERRWEEETRRQREEKRRKAEEEKRKWEEEERQWKLTEEARIREEEEAEARLTEEREQRLRNSNSNKSASGSGAAPGSGDPRLRGQYLSQYQADSSASSGQGRDGTPEDYSSRVRELEKELELARQREQAYERERQGRPGRLQDAADYRDDRARSKSRGARSRSRPRAGNLQVSPPVRQESWSRNDKEVLMTPRSQSRHRFADNEAQQQQQQQQPIDFSPPQRGDDREDEILPRSTQQQAPPPSKSPRPLPDPRNHYQQQQQQNPQLPPRLHNQRTGERQQQQQRQQQYQAPPSQQQQPPSQQQQSTGPTSFFQKIRTHRTGEKNPSPGEGNSGSSSPIRAQRTGDGPNKLTKSHGRPLPDPSAYAAPPQQQQPQLPPRQPPQPQLQQQPPQPTYSRELLGGGVAEHDAEDRRRRQQAYQPNQQQQPLIKQRQPFKSTPPQATVSNSSPGGGMGRPGGAGKSLLEREMEMERQRQREWEEAQRATAAAPRQAENVEGINGRWDVNQWSGYTGGDGQNRGSQGIGAGRRQIVGPRPLPGQR
ncbi:calponin [Sporothrix eucalyptigena]|uniref:Calponin n=1 Tax=Sporothrix eucalyptigena TaxID=1812306 RepID=A0ABP0BX22_9PEZI